MKFLFFILILSIKYASCMPTTGAAEAHADENDHSHLLETQISHSTTAKENDETNAHVKENGHENVKRNSDDHHHEGYEKRSGTNGHIEHAIDKESDEHHQKRSTTIDGHHNPEKRHSEHPIHHANHGSHTPSPENRKKRNSDQGISESNEEEPEEDAKDVEKEIVKRNIDPNHQHQEPQIVDENASETSHHDLNERSASTNPEAVTGHEH